MALWLGSSRSASSSRVAGDTEPFQIEPATQSWQELIVTALQSAASRLTSPFEPVVGTLASFHSGDAFNVIPESAEFTGTVRTFSRESEASVEAQMVEIVRGVATSSGVKIEMEGVATLGQRSMMTRSLDSSLPSQLMLRVSIVF